MRVKRGITTHRRHKKILKSVKGYIRARRSSFRKAKEAWIKAGQYSYRDRKNRKRDFRQLWNVRINAGARQNELKYSTLIAGMKNANVKLNRKSLSYLALEEPQAFSELTKLIVSLKK